MSSWQFLVNRRGRTATLISGTTSVYNPATGKNEVTGTPYEIKAYFAEYNLGEQSSNEVSVGTRWVGMGTVDTSGNPIPKPTTDDKITNDEDTVVVSKVQTIYNGETPVVYLCTVSE